MPYAAKKPCLHPLCKQLVAGDVGGYCDEHRKEVRKLIDDQRGNSAKRGYNHKWRKARETFLRREPLCVFCKAKGLVVAATVVDHVIPHRGDTNLFWDSSNWQSLCKPCHDKHKQRMELAADREGGG